MKKRNKCFVQHCKRNGSVWVKGFTFLVCTKHYKEKYKIEGGEKNATI